MSEEYDSDIWGVWDPIGNPHDWNTCLCPYCDSEQARINQRLDEERADEQARIAESIALSRKVREHREKYDTVRLAEEDRWSGISYRLAMGLEVTPEAKRWHDEVLAERRECYARTKGES